MNRARSLCRVTSAQECLSEGLSHPSRVRGVRQPPAGLVDESLSFPSMLPRGKYSVQGGSPTSLAPTTRTGT